jgi:hypothetical protein
LHHGKRRMMTARQVPEFNCLRLCYYHPNALEVGGFIVTVRM